METSTLLLLGAAGIGGYFLWQKMGPGSVAATYPQYPQSIAALDALPSSVLDPSHIAAMCAEAAAHGATDSQFLAVITSIVPRYNACVANHLPWDPTQLACNLSAIPPAPIPVTTMPQPVPPGPPQPGWTCPPNAMCVPPPGVSGLDSNSTFIPAFLIHGGYY